MKDLHDFVWVRYTNDKGRWWPAVRIGAHEEASSVIAAFRIINQQGDPTAAPKPTTSKRKISICLVLKTKMLVEATQVLLYQEGRLREGLPKDFTIADEAQCHMDSIMKTIAAIFQGRQGTTTPETPSTVCPSTCSTEARATPLDVGSPFPAEFGDSVPQQSPAGSTLSTGTELEYPTTQLEPCSDDQADGEKWSGTEIDRNIVEKSGELCSPFLTCRLKRSRGSTSGVRKEQQPAQEHEWASLAQGDFFADPASPRRKKDRPTQNQFPRLGSSPRSPAAGSLPLCSQSAKREQDGYHFEQKYPMHEGMDPSPTGRAKRPDQPGVAPPAQDNMDVCVKYSDVFGSLAVGLSDSDAEEISYEDSASLLEGGPQCAMHFRTVQVSPVGWVSRDMTDSQGITPLSARRNGGEEAPEVPDILNRFEHVLSNKVAPFADAKAEELSTWRGVGITGEEDPKTMMKKLFKLKWKWVPRGQLSNDYWVVKPGVNAKKAEVGVEKFETEEDVLLYVREGLGLPNRVAMSRNKENEKGEFCNLQNNDTRQNQLDRGKVASQDEKVEGRGEAKPFSKRKKTMKPEERALEAALEALNASNAPSVLKQRLVEFTQVMQFVTNCLTRPSGGSLYLCGCPGTGKTQTMARVQEKIILMSSSSKKGFFPAPKFHAFTGTSFTDPNAMHIALWQAVAGDETIPFDMEKALGKKLTYSRKPTPKSPMIVVVLDEIDQLMSQNRQVLRKLFEWAGAPKSRMVLVGIANSIEFDVGFSNPNQSPTKVLFRAYTPEDLTSILTERVGETVQKSAMLLCSKKIAATHGDARRAISVCREAVVLAKRELQDQIESLSSENEREKVDQTKGEPLVTMRHMSKALATGRASQYRNAIASLCVQAKIVLCVATSALAGVSGQGRGPFDGVKVEKCAPLTQGDLHEKCMIVWGRLGTGEGPNQVDFSGTIDMLAAQGLLKLKGRQIGSGRARVLEFQIDFADVEVGLKDQPFFKAVTSI